MIWHSFGDIPKISFELHPRAYFMYLWRTWDTKRDPGSMYDAAQAEYDEEFEKVCRITCTAYLTEIYFHKGPNINDI